MIHVSRITAAVFAEDSIFESAPTAMTDIEMQIRKHIAELVEDEATLQMGIGGIPNAALQF